MPSNDVARECDGDERWDDAPGETIGSETQRREGVIGITGSCDECSVKLRSMVKYDKSTLTATIISLGGPYHKAHHLLFMVFHQPFKLDRVNSLQGVTLKPDKKVKHSMLAYPPCHVGQVRPRRPKQNRNKALCPFG